MTTGLTVAAACGSGHLFHTDCLAVWLVRQPQCPTCRWRVLPDTLATVAAAAAAAPAAAARWATVRPPNVAEPPQVAPPDLRGRQPVAFDDAGERPSEWCSTEAIKCYCLASFLCFCGPLIIRFIVFEV